MLKMMVLALAGLLSLQCRAQNNDQTPDKQAALAQTGEGTPKRFYQLSFVVREVESDRVINSRSYFLILRGGGGTERGSIRTGEEVPFTSSFGTSTQVQQIHVGVNIDCRDMEQVGDQVTLILEAEISSVVENHGDKNPPPSTPIIRTNRWQSTVLLPLKQPTVLFSSDDPASKRKMQLQLTVVPLR